MRCIGTSARPSTNWGSSGYHRRLLSDLHPDLRLSAFLDRYIGAPFFVLSGLGPLLAAYTVPTLPRPGPGGVLLLGLFAVVFFWVAVVCWRRMNWYLRLSWVFANVEAVPMRVDFFDFGEGLLEGRFYHQADPPGSQPLHTALFARPPWSHQPFHGKVLFTHVDARPRGPLVVRTEAGILWCLKDRRQDRSGAS